MFLFTAKNLNSAYVLNINIPDKNIIYMKFDTGASFTTIPYSLLEGVIKEKQVTKFKCYNDIRIFETASSKTITGVLCSVENASIGGLKFPIFYFYLIFNTNRTVGLLGYEIIDNCRFSHDIRSDIIVSDFDMNKYQNVTSKFCNGLYEISFDECCELYNIHRDDETDIILVNNSGEILSDEEIIEEFFQDE